MLDINFAQAFIAFIVLLFSLTVHESAHAWTADRLGDPTARLLGQPALRARLAAAGRQLVRERYDWQASGQRLNQLVADCHS